jgi:hypothetical protein
MKRLLVVCVVLLPITACAARKSDAPATQSPASSQDASPATGGVPAYAQQPGPYAPPPPPGAPPGDEPKPEPRPTPATPATTPGGRAVALDKAASDIETAQRELDVAGSSCQNACRALGSMDRAAGHLCQLTREDSSQAGGRDRCDDAKRRLYNARDKVRGSCGTCPDNQPATDRNAPVPSIR